MPPSKPLRDPNAVPAAVRYFDQLPDSALVDAACGPVDVRDYVLRVRGVGLTLDGGTP